ncbi:VCBS repeat-containing protein [Splendidivirga corallicola]
MRLLLNILFVSGFLISTTSCVNQEKSNKNEVTMIFDQLSADQSGITFSNNLKEDTIINYFTYPYIYMGGGVAVGDLNNDGLQDLYFTGNMVENKLYLNKGNLQFEDITAVAKVGGDNRWMTGVTMVDINADGWLDIYVSVSGKFTTTKNLLYMNNGTDQNGIPTFTESAEKMGIADEGNSTQGTFFDYDLDGDPDLYVANYPLTSFKTGNVAYKFKMDKKDPDKSDKLYKNNGDGTFIDATEEAGLLNFGLSLSAMVGDFNNDGWEDIYVSNDFATPDYFYFNNGDGTFSEKIKETTQHTAFFGMGTDAGDFNNDGLLDIIQMDMTPEDNRRNKANMASMNPAGFWEIVGLGMHYQYMQNTLQLNNGIYTDGLPHFSDISRLAGISSTDWSWAGLFVDLDNNGWKDIFITNGTRRDINNKDYFNRIDRADKQTRKTFNYLDLSQSIPFEKIDNYTFRNNGDLTFSNVSKNWGLSYEGFSNGAAYADLDNDGDLDMVINNIDEPSVVYRNKTSDLKLANFLRIKLKGNDKNPLGLGTKVLVENGNDIQFQQHTLSRGFQSSVEPVIHFGLGNRNSIEKMSVTWPDGKSQDLYNVQANQVLEISYGEADETEEKVAEKVDQKLFVDVTNESGIHFKHTENPYDDFQYEVLLPHVYSRNGPGLAVGDTNGDGLDDFYIGGAAGSSGALYLQNEDGTFNMSISSPWKEDADQEDMGALLFDADADEDLDLYVVSGGNEFEKKSKALQDRLYINDGQGNFLKMEHALPEMPTSGSRVKSADYDNDGDLDLFIGGRIVPKSYPLPAKSYILRNDGLIDGEVKFTDVTRDIAPDLLEAGLVTDAVWVDYDQDTKLDLVVVGEWMPITFLKNDGKRFLNMTKEYDLEKSSGWWYSILAEDFDQDGDPDLVAGNLGLNYKYRATVEESFDVYAYDYDKNGHLDIVLGYYNDGVQYPVRGRQCSSEQIPNIKIKYEDYNSFASATLADIYSTKDLEASLHQQAWTFASGFVENLGNEKFEIRKLPVPAQLSSINAMVAEDINRDGHLDLVVAGNLYGAEIETTRNDASYGQFLAGDGQGNFKAVPFSESGFYLRHDTKDLAKIRTVQGMVILAANNHDFMKAIKINYR